VAVGFLVAFGSLAELAKHLARRDVVPLVTAAEKYSRPPVSTLDQGATS
jgi:hypothetical protein